MTAIQAPVIQYRHHTGALKTQFLMRPRGTINVFRVFMMGPVSSIDSSLTVVYSGSAPVIRSRHCYPHPLLHHQLCCWQCYPHQHCCTTVMSPDTASHIHCYTIDVPCIASRHIHCCTVYVRGRLLATSSAAPFMFLEMLSTSSTV